MLVTGIAKATAPHSGAVVAVLSELETAARQIAPNAHVVALTELVNAPIYDELVHKFKHEPA